MKTKSGSRRWRRRMGSICAHDRQRPRVAIGSSIRPFLPIQHAWAVTQGVCGLPTGSAR